MKRNSNEKEYAVIGREKKEIALFGYDRRIMIARAIRRFLILAVVVIVAYTFIRSDFAAERGFGIADIKSFFGKEYSETLPSLELDETETNNSESNSETESETEEECDEESESISSDILGNGVTEIDMSETEKGRLYFINYSNKAPDVEGILAEGFLGAADYYTEKPVVLVIHSQTSQAYCDADDGRAAIFAGVVSVGERIAYELNGRGIPTVHCTVIHDGEGDPYKNTASTIETMLEIYPSLKYVIDIQRMSLTDDRGEIAKTKVTDGSSQIRLTVSAGDDGWRNNLSLAMVIREKINGDGGKICIPVVLTDSNYNSGLSEYYLKVDVGASGNTFDEAKIAGELFAVAFAKTVKK